MPDSIHTEIRAALQDNKRVGVAITSAGAAGQSLKLLIGRDPLARENRPSALQADPAPGQSAEQEGPKPAFAGKIGLTRRELQVLRLIARGLHNRQIADRIHRSIKTVEKHRQNLHTKLSTHEVAGLTRYALSSGLMDRPGNRKIRLGKSGKQLTPRELEVLKLVAQGSGNKWIASELHRSIKTVDHHRENIMKKLNIHEVAGLTRYAALLGLM